MKMNKARLNLASPLLAALLASAGLVAPMHAYAAPLDIAQVPLYLGGTVEPNIMFILDDSGSMGWDYMPDGRNTSRNARTSSSYNRIYYNPDVKYLPPLDENGNSLPNANFYDAWDDGYRKKLGKSTDTPNLSEQYRRDGGYGDDAAYYHVYDANNRNCDEDDLRDNDCYDQTIVSDTSGPGGTDERQNFANWYSYYRTRMMAAKAGISRAFGVQGTGMRVGYGRIQKDSSTVDGIATSVIQRGVRDFADQDTAGKETGHRKAFFNWLFERTANNGTPLRPALDAAGKYYERTGAQGPASTTPGESGGHDLSCRQNFTILMTDGYWNGSAASGGANGDNDSSDGDPYTDSGPVPRTGQFLAVPPFRDDRGGTLADVAAYYYKRDLQPNLTNNVPTNPDDPAFWQHMVTFGVGLGVEGRVDDPATAFAAIGTGTAIDWGDPHNNDQAKIDDLLHAAVNSRGKFFSASDPNEFANALADTLETINARTSSAATVASNTTRLSTDTLLYQTRFDSGNWTGDLMAFEINQEVGKAEYGKPKAAPKWKASQKIPLPGIRKLVTYAPPTGTGAPATGTGTEFKWAQLTSTQKTALKNEGVLSWVRGERTVETQNGGTLRNRESIMGDVVNSDPVSVGREDYNYALAASLNDAERTSYATRRVSKTFSERKSALFFGANDGIFHAIDAETGDELFGYIPNAILGNLPELAGADYTHRYYVDGAARAADARVDNTWKTVLVGSTGAGGKAYFALDVENAHSLSSTNVMWEISNQTTGYGELGYAMGQAAIVRTESGHWVAIIGNGYNSLSKQARLLVVDLKTGALLKEMNTNAGSAEAPNGLATPIAIDANRNGSTDLVYAGDLYGNMWKFDFTGSEISDWKISFGGKPLFTAFDKNSKRQAITSKPQVGPHADGGLMLYFGTGKYFETGDNTDLAMQTMYGVRDECGLSNGSGCNTITTSAKVSRGNLLEQKIEYEGLQSFNGNSWEIRQFSENAPNTNHRGFFVDLAYKDKMLGERILATPLLWSDRVIFVSSIPDDDACAGGGTSWIIELAPESGGRTKFSVFDLARDGTYGDSSKYDDGKNKTVVNGRKVVGGMIKGLGQLRDTGKTFKYGATSSGTIDDSQQQNDSARRISWQQIQ